jgi:hypothetical protein
MKNMFLGSVFAIALTFMLIVPSVFAQSAAICDTSTSYGITKCVATFLFGTGDPNAVPDEWLNWNSVMQMLVFPFLAVAVILYGIMSEIHIFDNHQRIQIALAFLMVFTAGKWVIQTTRFMLNLNSVLAIVAWGILLAFGIIMWFFSTGGKMWRTGSPDVKKFYHTVERETANKTKLMNLEAELQKKKNGYWNMLQAVPPTDVAQRQKYQDIIKKIDEDLIDIQGKIAKK